MQTTETESNAAASAAGRELVIPVLQRNPLIALASALIGPILGLFKRRTPPPTVRRLRLESYSSSPVPGAAGEAKLDSYQIAHRRLTDREQIASRQATDSSAPKTGEPIPRGAEPCPARRRAPVRTRLNAATGGIRHA
jgi:hypothetical protein